VSTPGYQRRTAWIHGAIALLSLGGAAWLAWAGAYAGIVGLLLSAATNAAIGWEKWDLLRRGKA
jgi:hypothetical protein